MSVEHDPTATGGAIPDEHTAIDETQQQGYLLFALRMLVDARVKNQTVSLYPLEDREIQVSPYYPSKIDPIASGIWKITEPSHTPLYYHSEVREGAPPQIIIRGHWNKDNLAFNAPVDQAFAHEFSVLLHQAAQQYYAEAESKMPHEPKRRHPNAWYHRLAASIGHLLHPSRVV